MKATLSSLILLSTMGKLTVFNFTHSCHSSLVSRESSSPSLRTRNKWKDIKENSKSSSTILMAKCIRMTFKKKSSISFSSPNYVPLYRIYCVPYNVGYTTHSYSKNAYNRRHQNHVFFCSWRKQIIVRIADCAKFSNLFAS